MVVDIDADTVRQYQTIRRREVAAPKTINEEVGLLLRLLGDHGDELRTHLKREKCLKLKERQTVGKAFSQEQKEALLDAARVPEPRKGRGRGQKGTRSPFILPALALAFNTGMRHAEIRHLTWGDVDLAKRFLIVSKSKTDAG